jgi:hypothetical protein
MLHSYEHGAKYDVRNTTLDNATHEHDTVFFKHLESLNYFDINGDQLHD